MNRIVQYLTDPTEPNVSREYHEKVCVEVEAFGQWVNIELAHESGAHLEDSVFTGLTIKGDAYSTGDAWCQGPKNIDLTLYSPDAIRTLIAGLTALLSDPRATSLLSRAQPPRGDAGRPS